MATGINVFGLSNVSGINNYGTTNESDISGATSGWSLTGNDLADGTSILGSTSNNDFNIVRNNINQLTLSASEIKLNNILNVNSNTIKNVANPVNNGDAVNKSYADAIKSADVIDKYPIVDMTSNTSPAPYTVTSDNSSSTAWYAFSHVSNQEWVASNPAGAFVKISGGLPFIVRRIVLYGAYNGSPNTGTIFSWALAGSNDGLSWTNLITSVNYGTITQGTQINVNLPNNISAYSIYQFASINGNGNVAISYIGLYGNCDSMNIYGDNAMVGSLNMNNNTINNLVTPTIDLQAANKKYVDLYAATEGIDRYPLVDMTSNTTPAPYIVNTNDNSTTAWYAFAHLNATEWVASSPINSFIRISGGQPFIVRRIVILGAFVGSPNTGTITSWNISASNDAFNWTSLISSATYGSITVNTTITAQLITNKTPYTYYQFNSLNGTGNVALNNISLYANCDNVNIYGDNPMIKNLNMSGNTITNVTEPSVSTQVATKGYTDNCLKTNIQPTMTSNNTTIDGLLYIASASSIVNGSYPAWNAFRNAVISGDSAWVCGSTDATPWIQLKYPYPVKIVGFNIVLRAIAGRDITSWSIQGSNDGSTFTTISNATETMYSTGVFYTRTFTNISSYMFYRFNILSRNGGTDTGLSMLQFFDYNVSMKCYVPYVPCLETNSSKTGFTVSTSSQYSAVFSAFGAFNTCFTASDGNYGAWVTDGTTTNFWIQIQCPNKVRVWQIALRGRGSGAGLIYNWHFDASNDGTNWVALYTAPNPTNIVSTSTQFFPISTQNSYSYYRIYVVNANATYPGLSYWNLFVYNTVL